MALTYTYTLSDGTTAYGSQVMQNFNDIKTLLNTTGLDSSYIQAGTITNALVSASAGISVSKLAAGTAGQVLLNNSTPTPAWTSVTGDVTISSAGVTTIANDAVTSGKILDGTIVNADINASAAIAYSKLASMSTGQVLLGNGGTPTATTLSGDVTVGATGTTAIGSSKVLTAMLNDGAVTPAKITSGTGSSWAWQSWTPSWTNLTVGTGGSATNQGYYLQVGKTVFYRLKMTFGSSGPVMGSGPYFALPVAASTNVPAYTPIGNSVCQQTGVSEYSGLIELKDANNAWVTANRVVSGSVGSATLSSVIPHGWTAGDSIYAEGYYEVA